MPVLTPQDPPSFSIKELRDALPAYCFERSALKSSMYLIFDLTVISILFYFAFFLSSTPQWAQFILWPLYWFVQGLFMTGVWVIAHECGHQAFSESKLINDSVGLIFHSLLLVPYHSWRISHGMHHKSTGHLERDQVFVPKTRSKFVSPDIREVVEESPLYSLVSMVFMFLIGWPAYLLFNTSGQEFSRRTNHFEPDSPIFKPKHFSEIILSDLAILTVLGFVGWFIWTHSFLTVAKYYLIPYLWVNFWLVMITYLQHSDQGVPHYRGKEWTFIRGALATVDRDYGILNTVFHHITDSHVAHHLFSTMPHYHAVEATKHLKKILGSYYLSDNTPILETAWNCTRRCRFVEDVGDVLWFKCK